MTMREAHARRYERYWMTCFIITLQLMGVFTHLLTH